MDYLNREVRPGLSENSKLYATTLELENLFLIDHEDYDQAITNYARIAEGFADDPLLHQQALFGLGYIHGVLKEETRSGETYFEKLRRNYPKSELARNSVLLSEYVGFSPDMTEVEETGDAIILSNHPNPFNPSTVIRYRLLETNEVRLEVFDILGRQVAILVNGQVQTGFHEINFDGSNLSSGVYLYRLRTGSQVLTGKMMLMK